MVIRIDAATSEKLRKLDETTSKDWIAILGDIGEDPATFFQNSDWTGTDFSMSDMRGVSWKGAVIDGAKFRKGDLTPEAKAEALSANNIEEVDVSDTTGV